MEEIISEEEIIPQTLKDRCPECKSTNLIHDYDTGEIICKDCGLVTNEQMMAKGPEWRAYTKEEKESRSRVGAPESYTVHDKGLATQVGGGSFGVDYDAFGRKLSRETRQQMWRLRRRQAHTRVQASKDKNLVQALQELDRLSDKLGIPKNVQENAAIIYRKALDKGMTRGRCIDSIIAAALLFACRKTETPRTLKEIAKASLIDKKEIARCYRLLFTTFEIKILPPDAVKAVSKIAEKIGISGKSQGRAVEIIREAKEKKYKQGDPMAFAAGALYIACRENNERKEPEKYFSGPITQDDIAKAAQVTEVTVRNQYKKIKKFLDIELPSTKKRARKSLSFYFSLLLTNFAYLL